MKKLFLSFVLCTGCLLTFAQEKYFTQNGKVSFFSATSVENIEAHNAKASSVLDANTGKIEFALLIKAFQFEKALMQEHFNENYMESDKFPKSTFKGTIQNMKDLKLDQDGTYKVMIKGIMNMHGVEKEIEVPATFIVKAGVITGKSEFKISPSDYNIEIPGVVREKIAKEISVKADMIYQPLKK